MEKTRKLLVLVVLDGWGLASPSPGNAVTLAHTPNYDNLWANYPAGQLQASGSAVGLPAGADGNSEVGHLNLGAGRIVPQDVLRIDQSITNDSFFNNQAFADAILHASRNQSNLHLLGLIGGGVVHSANRHLFALVKLFAELNFTRVFLHLFTDGRDSPPRSALTFIQELEENVKLFGVGTIASISGRYYAMDRDWRWDRTEKTYRALTEGLGQSAQDSKQAVEKAYARGETDEFILPTLIGGDQKPIISISDNDSVIFFNFRIDRPRQLTKAFVLPDFEQNANKLPLGFANNEAPEGVDFDKPLSPFKRHKVLRNLFFVTMTEYEKKLPVVVAFPEHPLEQTLGEVVSKEGLKQLRAAESEKERFVTYYFNGFHDQPFNGEERLIVPSPKVKTYDFQPEMSIYSLTDAFIKKLETGNYPFSLLNFANPDMVGHTGHIKATFKACEAVDECLGSCAEFVLSQDGTLLVVGDHGNAEELIDVTTGEQDTKHSANPVPVIIVNKQWWGKKDNILKGILADVAPTVLKLFGLPQPTIMNGRTLVTNF